MDDRRNRISSTSGHRRSDDITSLDSWTDVLGNSVSSESGELNRSQDFRFNSSYNKVTKNSSGSSKNNKAKYTDNVSKQSKKTTVTPLKNGEDMNTINEQLDFDSILTSCEENINRPPSSGLIGRQRSSTSSTPSTSRQPLERPKFFANIKNTINKQSGSKFKYGNGSSASSSTSRTDSRRNSTGHLSSSDIDTNTSDNPNNVYGHNYSPSHGYHSGQNNTYRTRINNTEFGSDGTDLFVNRLETESEKVKTKLRSAWNNMKYGWTLKTKTNFKTDSAIIFLGKWYHIRPPEEDMENSTGPKLPSFEEFKQDFSSRLWFTYRRDFTRLPGTKITTDCGWGCMLRSGQCMIAQALIQHFLGRDWRIYNHQERDQEVFHREIIRWFSDISTDNSPFSIFKLVEMGKKTGKEPGEWYGPATVAHIFRDALLKSYRPIPLLSDLCIYVAQDCTVYKQDIIDECTTKRRSSTSVQLGNSIDITEERESSKWTKSVIVLVPVRLGGECLNESYIPCVKQLLSQENCIGIIGGKPKHSLYFLGWQDDKLIYLDPHYCQDAIDTSDQTFPIQSFHCMSPRKLHMSKMDPSCTIGFYCKTEMEFKTMERQIKEMVIPKKDEGMYPLFVFDEGKGCDVAAELLPEEQGFLRIRHIQVTDEGRIRSSTVESEDFVIL